MSERDASFERAFVAMRYLLGARGADLCEPLGAASVSALDLAGRLLAEDKLERATALAGELGVLVRALEARSYR